MPTSRARSIPSLTASSPAIAPVLLSLSLTAQHVIAGIAVFTALMAAGSCGLIGHPLRHALTLVGLLAIAAASIGSRPTIGSVAYIVLFTIVAAYLSASASMVVGTLGVVVLLGGITLARPDSLATFRPLVFAIFVFALYRLAHDSIATVWIAADIIGHFIGRIGGIVAGQSLNTGATFAALDALILMIALVLARLVQTGRPQLGRGALCITIILATHLLYLVILARCPSLTEIKPIDLGTVTLSFDGLLALLKDQIPWNLPILAAIMHAIVAFFLLRWTRAVVPTLPRRPTVMIAIMTATLAVALPLSCCLCWNHLDLTGKTIVFYKKGFLNWMKPMWGDYGRLSQGMYGLLADSSTNMENDIGGEGSRFLDLYGAHAIVSPDLSDADLKKADALVMLYPDKEWQPGQLDRVRKFVKDGGTLLVFADHTSMDPKTAPKPDMPRWPDEANARFNDVLADSNMRVRFDTGVFTVGGWLQSYEALSHPMTLGVRDDRNEFGAVIGASVDVRWPAKPILIGRFGSNDPGDAGRPDHAMLSNEKYDPGEQLGDVVLAAEQRVGAGRIVVFGDTSMMSNGLLHGCYDFDSRLLAYVSNRSTSPQDDWRQLVSLALLMALVSAAILQSHPVRIAACCAVARGIVVGMHAIFVRQSHAVSRPASGESKAEQAGLRRHFAHGGGEPGVMA